MVSQQLTTQQKESIVKKLTGGWDRVFDDATEVFDRANFVNDEVPRSPIAETVRSLSRLQCRRWARGTVTGISPSANVIWSNICTPYLNRINEKPAEGSLVFGPAKGACDCGRYEVSISYRTAAGNNTSTQRHRLRGPLGTPFIDLNKIRLPCRGFTPGIVSGYPVCGPQINADMTFNSSVPAGATRLAVIIHAAPDGDSCGPNVTTATEPDPITGVVNVGPTTTVNIPGYGPVTATVTGNPDGSIEVCIAELDVCFTVGVDSDQVTDGGGSSVLPGDVGEPGSPVNTNGVGEAEGDAPTDEVLGGLKIEILSLPPFAKPYQNGIYRGVCYVFMGVDEELALHPDGSTLQTGQFVLPIKDNLTTWKVLANSGYNLSVTPYYKEV